MAGGAGGEEQGGKDAGSSYCPAGKGRGSAGADAGGLGGGKETPPCSMLKLIATSGLFPRSSSSFQN